jgi:hypothetical protein
VSRIIGQGRYARETYPDGTRGAQGPPGPQGTPGSQGPAGNALTFVSPAALAAFDATGQPNFQLASVGVVNNTYRFLASPTANLLAAVDGVNVISPAGPLGAVFVRTYDQNLPAQYETAWFIDPAGSDANTGTVIGAPLKTLTEWCRRMQGATVSQDVTVTCGVGTITGDMILSLNIVSPALIMIQGNVTEDAGHTVTAVTASNPATGVRGFIDSADAFTDQQRIRFSGNETPAIANAIADVTGLNGGPTSAFISTPGVVANFHPPNSGVPVTGFPEIGDTYFVQTLNTTLNPPNVDISVSGSGRLMFYNFNLSFLESGGGPCVLNVQNENPGTITSSVFFYNCALPNSSDFMIFGGAQAELTNCSFNGLFAAFNNSVLFMRTGVFRRVASASSFGACYCGENSYIQFGGPNVFDSGTLVVDKGAIETDGPGDIQVVDGPTSGAGDVWFVGGVGCTLYGHNSFRIWGPSTGSGFARAWQLFTGCVVAYGFLPSVFSAGTPLDITMNATLRAYTDLPYTNAAFATTMANLQ